MFDGTPDTVRIFMLGEPTWIAWAERLIPSIQRLADGSGGRYSGRDIIEAVKAGRIQLWPVVRGDELLGVMASEVVTYPQFNAFRIIGAVGRKPRLWMHLLEAVETVARDVFLCTRMECLHQPGHERMLRTPGWKIWHNLSEKQL